MQQGEHVAKNIKHILNGEAKEDFHYVNRGTVCSLGSHDGQVSFMAEILQVKSCIHEESH